DGIRDVHVTGVQTCALPISAATAARRPGRRAAAAAAPHAVLTRGPSVHAGCDDEWTPPLIVKLLHLCDSLFPIGGFAYSDGLEEIGRASCRERVQSGWGSGAWWRERGVGRLETW